MHLLNLVISLVVLLAVLFTISAQKKCVDGEKLDDKNKNMLKASQVILILAAGVGVAMNAWHMMMKKEGASTYF